MKDPGAYRFDGFTFDPTTGELAGPRETVRLAPKAARLLALLVERPGELVPRERVRDELWPGQHVELDQVLAYTVRQVRAALGDEGGEPRFVETLPRRGYRFLTKVEASTANATRFASPQADGVGSATAVSPAPSAAAAAPTAAPRPHARAAGSATLRRPVAIAVAVLAVVAIALAATAARVRNGAGIGATAARVRNDAGSAASPSSGANDAAVAVPIRIALLPLGQPALADVNDPLTEALVVALTAQPDLAVLGPATTASLRGTTRPHDELGRELGVAFVASGGYRPAEQFLFLQLVRTSDAAHVFAHRYWGDPAAVRAQLDEAAAAIAAAARHPRALSPDGRPAGRPASGSTAGS